jgi:hypothetical protein
MTPADLVDPVVDAWVHLGHPTARRLVPHGASNKGIHFSLMTSRLPWTATADAITGAPGAFWVLHVVLEDRHLYIDDYWAQQPVRALLPIAGHIIQPSSSQIAVTLPAVGDPQVIADAIGGFFESIFAAAGGGEADDVRHPWRRTEPEFDPRVDASGLLSVLAGLDVDDQLSIFAAG